jgi:hypothetical protein
MAFSVFVEMLNLRLRAKSEHPVHLHSGYEAPAAGTGFTPSPDSDLAM